MVQILGKEVGHTGYGMMGLTWRKNPVSQEQAFKDLKEALNAGAVFWNGGELYGTEERNSMHLLNEYFTKYPEDADKIVLSVKGGLGTGGDLRPNGTEENIKRSIDTCLKILDGKCKLDIFEMARVDPNVPVETSIAAIDKHVQAGKIRGIALSEVSEKTIRRAAKVAKISAVEVEFSLFSTDILTNGIAQACAELDIPVVAYSPMSRGMLTGEIRRFEDLPEHDLRRHFPRFQPGVFEENIKLVEHVEAIARKKGVTSAQVALAWIRTMSGRNGVPQIIPIPGATTEARIAENSKEIFLTEEEMKNLEEILSKFEVQGERYGGAGAAHMNG